ncbi:hypothetical protein [Bacillus badius]|nr:hypothetical protein [Bacillus badius]
MRIKALIKIEIASAKSIITSQYKKHRYEQQEWRRPAKQPHLNP